MSEIPPEAQEAIEEFKRQEAARQAAQPVHKKRKEIRAEEDRSRPMAPMMAEEVISLAQSQGWELQTGGEHPKLVKGKRRVSIPVHGGAGRNLATGTLKAILKIIKGET